MEEFEPKRRFKIINKELIAKYAYVFVLAVLLIGGISYGYTFFTQNRKIVSGSITTANLTVNFTNRSINATNLSKPSSDKEGLSEFSKSLTITNQTAIDGIVELTLTRSSGLSLNDLRYALIINGAIQEIMDVPQDGKILRSAIMGNETINVELRLWPKTTYTGSTTTFAGELTPSVRYLGITANTSISSPAGKYVNFNCSSVCEVWRIVKVESGRLVLTRDGDYSGATERTNSNKYDSSLTFNDNSLITSVSTDGKNVYLARTVKVDSGEGTIASPYNLVNTEFREPDKKVLAQITYKDSSNTTVGTQKIYYNETNYISKTINNPDFTGWTDGTNDYELGDVINTSTDILLTPIPLSRNDMVNFSGTTYFTSSQASSITEIEFIKMNETQINSHANIVDLTNQGGSGVVKAWVNGTKLYIASPGETYFPTLSGSIFSEFTNVTNITFNNINTSSVTSMNSMFKGCSSLTSIDLSKFNISNVLNMEEMFDGATSLVTIEVGSTWNTTNVTSSNNMFNNCSSLVGGSGTVYDSTIVDKTRATIDEGVNNPGYLTLKTTS